MTQRATFHPGGAVHDSLAALQDGPLTVAELRAALRVPDTKPARRKHWYKLEAARRAGLIAERQTRLVITDTGREALEDFRAGMDVRAVLHLPPAEARA